jgi:hypothetical protein
MNCGITDGSTAYRKDIIRRHRFDRKEVASPQRLSMPLQEIDPTIGRPIGAGPDSFFLEDVPHCLAADFANAQLGQLAKNLGIAKGSGAGDLQNELAILARLSPEIPAPIIAIRISGVPV